jgi:hypothetical protein
MKTLGLKGILWVAFLLSGCIASFGQASQAEVPGDNFSLEGALELFKKSSTPEQFEKMLNSPESKVNNLDLNGDGYIDYVRVIDLHEGDVHTFVIQAVVADNEFQDIAVIALEKLANGKAVLQITGDEDIYGVTTIIEPTQEVRTYAGTTTAHAVVNVWAWPSVQYIYGPYYAGWVSPWRWSYRPFWWRPWRPIAYYDYYPIWRHYYPYYTVCHSPRIVYAHRIYHPHRRTSVIVYHRHSAQIDRYRSTYRDSDRNGRTRYDGNRGSYSEANANPDIGTTNGRQRLDSDNRRQISRESVDRINATRRDGSLSSPAMRSRTTRQVPERNSSSLDNNDNTLRQPVTRPSSTERTWSGSTAQRSGSRTTGKLSDTPVQQQRSVLPDRNDASRMRSGTMNNNNNAQRRQLTAPPASNERKGGSPAMQRSGNTTIQRSTGSPVQQQRSTLPGRDDASGMRSGSYNNRNNSQRQQITPPPSSSQRSGSSGSSTIKRSGSGGSEQGSGANRRGGR